MKILDEISKYIIVFAVRKHLNSIRIVYHNRVWTCFEISRHQMGDLCTYIIHQQPFHKAVKFKVHLKHCLTTVNFGYIHTRNTETLHRKQFCNILLIEKQLTKYFNFLNLKICVMFHDKNRIFMLIFKA